MVFRRLSLITGFWTNSSFSESNYYTVYKRNQPSKHLTAILNLSVFFGKGFRLDVCKYSSHCYNKSNSADVAVVYRSDFDVDDNCGMSL